MGAVAGTVGSAGLSVISSVMSGRATARAMANEAGQYDTQAKAVDLQALQTSERQRENLRAAVAGIEANRAARGLSLDSPSGIAIEKEIRRQAVRDEGVDALGFINQSSSLRAAARAKRRGASSAIMASYLEAGSTAFGAAQSIASTMGSAAKTAAKLPATTAKAPQKKRSSL
jgi:hypothetical protein